MSDLLSKQATLEQQHSPSPSQPPPLAAPNATPTATQTAETVVEVDGAAEAGETDEAAAASESAIAMDEGDVSPRATGRGESGTAGCEYELYAVLVHSGSASFGHYYALIKDLAAGEWHEFNDSTVRPIKQTDLVRAFGSGSGGGSAYLLLYRAVGQWQVDVRAPVQPLDPAVALPPLPTFPPHPPFTSEGHDSPMLIHDEKRLRLTPPGSPMEESSQPQDSSTAGVSGMEEDSNPYTTFF
ncbi:MAG: hypothetical protein SGPRY_015010 [Prymnesium sp.]